MSFESVLEFEKEIAKFYGAKYAVAVDCCTHALELCLRYTKAKSINVPVNTYISVPFLSKKLNIDMSWREEDWVDYYSLTDKVIDAAVLWKKDSYVPGKFMCVSFQFRKHLNLGRGGMILMDDVQARDELKKMSYDGRLPDIPWREQNIKSVGYHYYMTPETATMGLEKLDNAIDTQPEKWSIKDWPDLRTMDVFKNEERNEE